MGKRKFIMQMTQNKKTQDLFYFKGKFEGKHIELKSLETFKKICKNTILLLTF